MSTADPAPMADALKLFDALVERPAREQAEQLTVLAATNAPLAAAVRRLLDADADASGLLDRGVDNIAHTLLTELGEPQAARPAIVAGAQMADFTLIRPLGIGGMGEVWLARRSAGNFSQEVALKLLKRGMDSDEISRRFVRERRILAELNHPHIAGFIDGGIGADGRLYYAMEYVDGEPITAFARVQALDVRARMRLLATVCEAVAHAQSHLVVHRDLKPSNILVDAGGQPRVLDFGIAKLVGETVADTALTASGLRMLSPAYAAPEQVLDESISTATDVYSLGVIAFELLTGGLPHARSGNVATMAEQVRDASVQAPSAVLRNSGTQREVATSGVLGSRAAREVAGDLDVIVLTALQREPARRYANAAALAEDLRRWLDGQPITAQADTTSYRLRKFVARNRLAVGSASAVLLALLAGLAVALWQASVAREQAALARTEAARAEAQTLAATAATERAKRVKDFMMQTFVQADPLRRAEGSPLTVVEALEQAIARVDTELQSDPSLQVDVLDDFGEIRAGQGRFDEARVLIQRALDLASEIYPPDHPAIAESLVNRAVIENYTGGDLPQAARDLERAVEILGKHESAEALNLANALSGQAAIYEQVGRGDEVLALLERSLALWRQHATPQSDGLGATLHNTATAMLHRGRFAEARVLGEEALAELIRLGGEHSPRQLPVLDLLAQIHYRDGDLDGALAISERQLVLAREAFPGPHSWTASALTEIGFLQMDRDDGQAAANLDEAIAMLTALDSGQVLMSLRYRALLARSEDGDAAALAYFDRAMQVCARRKLDHLLCDVVRANRAGILAAMGDGAVAMSEIDAAMASMRAKDAANENEYAQAMESRAVALRALGQHDAAIATQTEAIGRYLALFGETHEEVGRARRNLEKLR